MSERTDAPTEGQPSGEPGTFPDTQDPEVTPTEPVLPEPDADGPSDDEATRDDESDDAEPDAAPDESAPPPPPAPDTASRMDNVTKALERAAKNYTKAVVNAFGDDWMGCEPCPMCAEAFPGVITPAPLTESAIAAIRPRIGLPDLTTYRQDGHARTCDQCDGLGKTLTGSKVPKYATILCSDCEGTGFRSPLDAHRNAVATNGVKIEPPPTHVEDEPVPAMPEAARVALRQMLDAAENQGVLA